MKKIIISVLIVLGLLVLSYIFIKPNIKLVGSDITINYDEEYKELGYKATFLNKDVTTDVKVINSVNNKKVGTYNIDYTIKKYLRTVKKVRKVRVIDNEAPVITLKGSNSYVFLNDEYKDLGYTAIDNYDGDITNKVTYNKIDTSKVGNYVITYIVSDSSNNKTSVTRNLSVIENKNVSGIPVLMYHFFYDKSKGDNSDGNYTEITDFDNQMKYLSDNNYYIPTWEELENYIDGKIDLPEASVVITADDGNDSFFNLATPILKKYNLKATSFIITSWYSKETVKNLKKDYYNVDFQSHTHDMHRGGCSEGHGGLFMCNSYTKGMEDLKTSQDILNNNDVMCYPFGDVNDNVIKITKDSGYKLGFTTNYGKVKPGMDKYKLPRIRISNGISLNNFIKSL